MGMIFLYILPLIVIVVTYGGIIWHLHKKCRGTTLNITNNTLDPVWRKDLEFDGKQWYFSTLGVPDKTFQLARSIFSFHVDMFFLLDTPRVSLVINRMKHEN